MSSTGVIFGNDDIVPLLKPRQEIIRGFMSEKLKQRWLRAKANQFKAFHTILAKNKKLTDRQVSAEEQKAVHDGHTISNGSRFSKYTDSSASLKRERVIKSNSRNFLGATEGDHVQRNNPICEDIKFADEVENESFYTCSEDPYNISDKEDVNLSDIESQENSFQEYEKVINIYKSKMGFAGSLTHLEAEKGALMAKLRKEALLEYFNKEPCCQSPQERSLSDLTCQITINNITCDRNGFGLTNKIPSCYYMLVAQHKTTVSSTEIAPVDEHGILEFKNTIHFEKLSDKFVIKLKLYRLQVSTEIPKAKWRISSKRRSVQLPKLRLIGEHNIDLSTINRSSFSFDSEIVYANITPTINTDVTKAGELIIRRFIHRNKNEFKIITEERWCILERTNLLFYRKAQDVGQRQPMEIMPLAFCKSCTASSVSPKALVLEFVHNGFGRMFLLLCEEENMMKDWMRHINYSLGIVKSFGI